MPLQSQAVRHDDCDERDPQPTAPPHEAAQAQRGSQAAAVACGVHAESLPVHTLSQVQSASHEACASPVQFASSPVHTFDQPQETSQALSARPLQFESSPVHAPAQAQRASQRASVGFAAHPVLSPTQTPSVVQRQPLLVQVPLLAYALHAASLPRHVEPFHSQRRAHAPDEPEAPHAVSSPTQAEPFQLQPLLPQSVALPNAPHAPSSP